MATETSCGALVVNKNGSSNKILLIRNRGGNYWGFPKGHREEGETLEETALREIREETGLEIELIKGFSAETAYKKDNGNTKYVTYFLAEPVSPEVIIQEEEISGYTWLEYSDCMEKLTYRRDKNVLKQAENYIQNISIK